MTGLEYIKSAMRLAGILDGAESPKGEEGDDALDTLNRMIRSWSMEIGPIFSRKLVTHTLTAGTFRYTIGKTTYNTDPETADDIGNYRPQQVLSAHIRSGEFDYPLDIVIFKDYQAITAKGNGNGRPTVLCYNSSAPSGVIYLWPPPDSAYSLRMTVLFPFKEFALETVSGDVTASGITFPVVNQTSTEFENEIDWIFPPGYDHAIVTNLAALLGVEYGISLSRFSQIQAMAIKSKADIKCSNIDIEALQLDPRLPESRDRAYGSFSDFQAGW